MTTDPEEKRRADRIKTLELEINMLIKEMQNLEDNRTQNGISNPSEILRLSKEIKRKTDELLDLDGSQAEFYVSQKREGEIVVRKDVRALSEQESKVTQQLSNIKEEIAEYERKYGRDGTKLYTDLQDAKKMIQDELEKIRGEMRRLLSDVQELE